MGMTLSHQVLLLLLVSISRLEQLNLMVDVSNFKFGILQAKKDLELLQLHIIVVLWEFSLYTMLLMKNHSEIFVTGLEALNNMLQNLLIRCLLETNVIWLIKRLLKPNADNNYQMNILSNLWKPVLRTVLMLTKHLLLLLKTLKRDL